MSIGKKINALRKQKNITAHEFAVMCGQTSRSWTHKLEGDLIKNISHNLIKKMCVLFEVSDTYFDENNDEVVNEPIVLYSPTIDLVEKARGYKDKYLALLEIHQKVTAENIRLKNLLLQHKIDVMN